MDTEDVQDEWPNQNPIAFDAIGSAIIASDGPRYLKVPIKNKSKTGKPILHCFARHEDCVAALKDDETFSLSLYDMAFADLGNDLQALLSADPAREQRMAMLHSAMAKIAQDSEDVGCIAKPKASPTFPTTITKRTEQNARTLLSINQAIAHASGKPRTFNAIRQYVFPMASISVAQIVGVTFPDRLRFASAAFIVARNAKAILKGEGALFRPRSDLAASANQHLWMLMLSAQIINAGEHKNTIIQKLAQNAITPVTQAVEEVLKSPKRAIPGSIAEALMSDDVRRQYAALDNRAYALQARNILIELSIAMGGLMPLAMTNILQFAYGPDAANARLNLAQFETDLTDEIAGARALKEALRMNPPVARLYRKVMKSTKLGGATLEPDDWVALIMTAAARDQRVFAEPELFKERQAEDYLEFGHVSGAHSCFGQHVATTISRITIHELTQAARPDYAPDIDGLKLFLQMPDQMSWKFRQP